MMKPPVPTTEEQRLSALHALEMLDTPAEERFDRITRLAMRMFDVPIAYVSLVDGNRQWFKSCYGINSKETTREISFCGHAVLEEEALVIPDAQADERFCDNPLVTGPPHIRFYAGQPVRGPGEMKVGTLCVVDRRPREFSDEDRETLKDMGQLVERELNLQEVMALRKLDKLTSAARALESGRFRGSSLLDLTIRNDELGHLARAFKQMAEEIDRRQRALRGAQLETIQKLVLAAEFKDTDTAVHVRRMSLFAALLARAAGMDDQQVELVRLASMMHDVGKLAVPESILLKPGKLSADEWAVMRQHPVYGANLLCDSDCDLLQMAELIALTHHERWDGSGYPNGLRAEEIPLVGRICAIADVFDALTSRRPYKDPMPNEAAFGAMLKVSGSHFDPDLLETFLRRADEIRAVQIQCSDDNLFEL